MPQNRSSPSDAPEVEHSRDRAADGQLEAFGSICTRALHSTAQQLSKVPNLPPEPSCLTRVKTTGQNDRSKWPNDRDQSVTLALDLLVTFGDLSYPAAPHGAQRPT